MKTIMKALVVTVLALMLARVIHAMGDGDTPGSPVEFIQGMCDQKITRSVTLTQDIGPCTGDAIIIARDGITLDGDGYKIVGSGGNGVVIRNKRNVVIKNLFVQGFEFGLVIQGGKGNHVYTNRFSGNSVGVFLNRTKENTVRNNIVAENAHGISISERCSDNWIYHNIIINNDDDQVQYDNTNSWMDPEYGLGNFWGNYWGEDDGSNGRIAGDFVGDTGLPHEGVDNAPLLDPAIPMRFGGEFLCGDWWGSSLWLVWRGGWSPVDIKVTNPFNQSISRIENEIGPDAFYMEERDFESTRRIQILIGICTLNPFAGNYSFQMSAEGLDDLTYSMMHFASGDEGIGLQHSIQDGVLNQGETQFLNTWVDDSLEVMLNVPIDIKPGSDPNCINPGSGGKIPVAILTTKTFDATTVDPASVLLDGAPVAFEDGSNEPMAHIDDVNHDGFDDLMLQFENTNAAYEDGESIATLTGETVDGTPITGTDTICIVP